MHDAALVHSVDSGQVGGAQSLGRAHDVGVFRIDCLHRHQPWVAGKCLLKIKETHCRVLGHMK